MSLVLDANLVETSALPSVPSEAIERLWLSVADSYDGEALRPLWSHNYHLVRQYAKVVGRPRRVMEATVSAIAQCLHYSGTSSLRGHAPYLRLEVSRLAGHPRSWLAVQAGVQEVVAAWREIGL